MLLTEQVDANKISLILKIEIVIFKFKQKNLDTFHAVPVYLVDELVLVFYSPLMIELMVDLLTIFTYVIIVLVLWGVGAIL